MNLSCAASQWAKIVLIGEKMTISEVIELLHSEYHFVVTLCKSVDYVYTLQSGNLLPTL
jgi:hypothetical protein